MDCLKFHKEKKVTNIEAYVNFQTKPENKAKAAAYEKQKCERGC